MATYATTSRYSLDASGQSASRSPVRNSTYTLYTAVLGDTLESISTRVLGDPLRFWEIADLNPQVKFPLDITAGTVLRVPL